MRTQPEVCGAEESPDRHSHPASKVTRPLPRRQSIRIQARDDDRRDADAVAVISYAGWQRRSLYGVMAYAVSRRTGEIGVRLAMGASPGRLVHEILRETAAVIGLGLAIGVPVGLFTARLVRTELFGIEPTDPFTLAAAAALIALVGLAAGFAPARRASRVDPLTALRAE